MSPRGAPPPSANSGATPDLSAAEQRFAAALARLGASSPLLLAVSGGPDSMAMLVLAAAVLPGRVTAATVDHGLRTDAADEALMVAAQCARIGVQHATLSPAAPIEGASLQARARAARYALLADYARAVGATAILTAHHADDAAETFLMRAARGSGLAGLAGVRARTMIAGVRVLRPLLDWRRAELRAIVERDELQAERQLFGRQATRHRDAGQARHVHRHREGVVEIHGDRVLPALLPHREGRRRGRRREDRVDSVGEGGLEVLAHQRADLLGLEVIGVVIAGREHVGADHDAPAHLRAEARRAGVAVHVGDVAARHPQAVADAVVAGEVGRGFRRRHDVIGGQRVFRVRQRDVDDAGARGLQPGDALGPEGVDLGRHAVDAVFAGNADDLAGHRGADRGS